MDPCANRARPCRLPSAGSSSRSSPSAASIPGAMPASTAASRISESRRPATNSDTTVRRPSSSGLTSRGLGEAFVFDRRQRGDAFAQNLLEGAQLGAEDQALEHAAGLAIEREDTAPESILVPGGRERRIGRESGSGHRLKRLRLCNPRTIGTVCVSAAYPSIDKAFTRTGRRRQAAEVTKSVRGCQTCNCGKVARMTNPGEVDALKAAMRGARQTGEQVLELVPRVEALDSRADFPDADLDDLRRVSSAHAVAAQALRGLVETMLRRRGRIVDEATGGSSGGDAE